MTNSYYIHPTSIVDDKVAIGDNTKICHFSHIQSGAKIGSNCSLGQNVNISSNVIIGDGVKIQNNVSVYEGVTLEDYVFCGSSCVFTNDLTPRARYPKHGKCKKTIIRHDATMGANCTIVCGHEVGHHATIAAGAVVATNVPPHALMVGVPAKQIGWVCECGQVLERLEDGGYICPDCRCEYEATDNKIEKTIYCAICGIPLTEKNRSNEHIIPNAIGGVLENSSIFCKECNGKFGTDLDRAFTDIFAPIVGTLKIHKDRKTKGTPYWGCLYDDMGKAYRAEYKSGKVWTIRDDKGTFLSHKASPNMSFGGLEFNVDNNAFKMGLAKMAFDFAIHCGINSNAMNKLFDFQNKTLLSNPTVIPFIPMTPFDTIMEFTESERLFHALRLFNTGNMLYVYIELFSTFQFYVCVSDNYETVDANNMYSDNITNINIAFCQYIEENEKMGEQLIEELTPHSPKDADIIMRMYNINQDDIIDRLKRSQRDENKNVSWNEICEEIGKQAFKQCSSKSYVKDYREILNDIFSNADFLSIAKDIMDVNSQKLVDEAKDLYESIRFYSVYGDDYVNIDHYKRFLPSGIAYPEAILNALNIHNDAFVYTKCKFGMLERRLRDK